MTFSWGQFVAALLQDLNQRLRSHHCICDVVVAAVAFGKPLAEEFIEFLDASIILPFRIGNILGVAYGNHALRRLVSRRLNYRADRRTDVVENIECGLPIQFMRLAQALRSCLWGR